jgi:hypothetical protein
MNKPKEKYWKIGRGDIGTSFGNPNYVQWADERIKELECASIEKRGEEFTEWWNNNRVELAKKYYIDPDYSRIVWNAAQERR